MPEQPDAFRKLTRSGTEPGPGPGLGPRPGPGPVPVPGPERGLELELELESNSSKTVQMAKYAKRKTAHVDLNLGTKFSAHSFEAYT